MPVTTMDEAIAVAHTLSKPSKMPGYAYSLPADACKLGSLLRKLPGTTCSHCYALKGHYVFPAVRAAMAKRLAAIDHPLWVEAMAFMIGRKKSRHFRWHDSGDLQSVQHFANICRVCDQTSTVRHWLPTREFGIVKEFLAGGGKIPDNLTVRVSAPKVGKLPDGLKNLNLPMSGVDIHQAEGVIACEAGKRGGKCGSCRACWDPSVSTVSYPLH